MDLTMSVNHGSCNVMENLKMTLADTIPTPPEMQMSRVRTWRPKVRDRQGAAVATVRTAALDPAAPILPPFDPTNAQKAWLAAFEYRVALWSLLESAKARVNPIWTYTPASPAGDNSP